MTRKREERAVGPAQRRRVRGGRTIRVAFLLPFGGECPACGGETRYTMILPTEDGIAYEFQCPSCKVSGLEIFDFHFSRFFLGHDVAQGSTSKRRKA